MSESSEDNEPVTDLEDYFISDSDDDNLEVSFSNLSIDGKYQITWPDKPDNTRCVYYSEYFEYFLKKTIVIQTVLYYYSQMMSLEQVFQLVMLRGARLEENITSHHQSRMYCLNRSVSMLVGLF